ncbi:type III secretion system cytoplasmic ring protein SctQ [Shewanella sp. VB17]|uniref:type III secretion system cytoplasmic ring protein SctQ n=1 Tax=Shewanella sp. VB17 TaxID=2739432 RepID=UPI001562F246|nr:type III secretion system cytoplasmic ring protein SctQ [Shewanella sp. VB17]NRD71759.1 type III secretion system cytoplasmic ring protein SctQ [Shewanella sp. VB17]
MLSLPFPKIDSQTVALNNLLRSRAQSFHIDDQLSLAAELGKRPSIKGYELECIIGSKNVILLIQAEQTQGYLNTLLQGTPFNLLPELLQLEFIAAAIAPYQTLLADTFGQQAVIASIRTIEIAASDVMSGCINIINQQIGITCWIKNDPKFIFAALPPAPSTIGNHIPLLYSLAIGYTSLSLDETKSLQPGDIIFFDINHLTDSRAVLIIENKPIWHCSLIDNQITITAAEIENPMPSDNTDIQSLPINISFEIGEQTVTVAELSQLQEQFVFELSGPLDQPVKLKANGKVLATGELVKINEHLGVRVINLMNKEIS